MDNTEDKNKIFRLIQEYLKPCPVIIWGSGGTIPFGMPSMQELKKHLKIEEKGNIEEILDNLTKDNKEAYNDYKNKIFKFIKSRDATLRKKIKKDDSILQPLFPLIRHCYAAHPHNVNIITTNYDCVLEYCLSIKKYSYSDGFSGREFSQFDEKNFGRKNCVNLLKVHGSLRWGEKYYSYFNTGMEAILPTEDKYKYSYEEPFRTLIHKSDTTISDTESILSIGFGFNDKHLTPEIDKFMEEKKKIIIVAKKATETVMEKINAADKFVLIEEEKGEKTKFSFKEEGKIKIIILENNFWKLDGFIQIIG